METNNKKLIAQLEKELVASKGYEFIRLIQTEVRAILEKLKQIENIYQQ
jgi:hypothetical protein